MDYDTARSIEALPQRPRRPVEPYLGTPSVQAVGAPKQAVAINPDGALPKPPTHFGRGVWLGLLAFLVGVAGQVLLFNEAQRLWGAGLLGVAALMGVIAWSRARDLPMFAARGQSTPAGASPIPRTLDRITQLRIFGVVVSLALVGFSYIAYRNNPDAEFGLQGVLWLASVAVLIGSCASWRSKAGGIIIRNPRWSRMEVAVLAGILVLSLVTHLAFLADIPWQIEGNEFTAWREGMHFFPTPATASMFGTGFLNLGMPNMWFWPEGMAMRLFGPGLVGARFWASLSGAVMVLPAYGLIKLAWGRTAAEIAAFFVAVSAVLINYSRTSLPNIGTTLWWTVCFYFLLRGLRSRRPSDFMWAGVAAGLSQFTHYATRLLPLLLFAYLVYLLIFHFKQTRGLLGHFALLAGAGIITQGPLTAYFSLNPGQFTGRGTSELTIPMAVPTTWDAIANIFNIIAHESTQNFLALSVIGSRDTFYYAPFLQPAEAVLAVLGFGLLIWRWRQPASALMILWLGSIMLVAALIYIPANPNPAFHHWSPAWVVFFFAIALPPALWLNALRRAGRGWWRVGAALVGVGLLAVVITNAWFYLVIYPPTVPRDVELRATQGRLLMGLNSDNEVRVVGCCWFGLDTEYASWLAPNVPAGQFFNPSRNLPVIADSQHTQVFIVNADRLYYLPLLQEYYPGGTVQPASTGDGSVVETVYKVPGAQVMARYGVLATFADSRGKQLWQGQTPRVGSWGAAAISLGSTVSATWQGLLYIPALEQAVFTTTGAITATLSVNGQSQPLDTPVTLDAGWVPFSVQATLTSAGTFRLLVGNASNPGAAAEIDTPYLWPQEANTGLAVTQNAPGLEHRIDSFIGSSTMRPPSIYQPGALDGSLAAQTFQPFPLTAAPATSDTLMSWSGQLLSDGGQYTMQLLTDDQSKVLLQIDGQVINAPCGPLGDGTRLGGQVQLAQGWHDVHVNLQAPTVENGRGLEWIWTTPTGTTEIVPPSHLRYAAQGASANWPQMPAPFACQK